MKKTAGMRERTNLVIASIVAGIVVWSVMHAGVPALRHDWWFPQSAAAMPAVVRWYADGWSPFGFGSLQAYPTFYPIAACWWLLGGLQPDPYIGLCTCIFATAVIASLAAMSLARKAAWYGRTALAIVAAANPWVATEYLAGHVYMVLAYAVVLALVAEILREKPREYVLCIVAAFSIIQIEFSVLVTIPFACWLLATKRYRPLLVLVAFLAPIVFGIVSAYSSIHATAYGIDWQRAESVHLLDGLRLSGYEFSPFPRNPVVLFTMTVLGGFAAFGTVKYVRRRTEIFVIVVALAAAVYASGLSGFFGFSYAWLVTHIKESGLFRELYDVLAILAIAYCISLAALFRRRNIAAAGSCIVALGLLWPWIAQPLSDGFVSQSALPAAQLPFSPQARTVLLPAFQPLSFAGRGSGADPQAFIQSSAATPLNEWFPSFPVDAALAYAQHGRYDWAQALGAASIISRSGFASTDPPMPQLPPKTIELAAPVALCTFITASPKIATVGDQPFEHAIFFGDVHPDRIQRFEPSLLTHMPSEAWVDARIDVARHPEEASAFGGIVTTSREPLPMPRFAAVLARADGRLFDDHRRVVIGRSAPQQWYRIANDVRALHCEGRCMIALAGNPPIAQAHIAMPAKATQTLNFHAVTPWFGYVQIPPYVPGTLRFNTRFEAHWIAVSSTQIYAHFRLNSAINAWNIPGPLSAQRVYLIHVISLVQAILECFAGLLLIVMLFRETRIRARSRA